VLRDTLCHTLLDVAVDQVRVKIPLLQALRSVVVVVVVVVEGGEGIER